MLQLLKHFPLGQGHRGFTARRCIGAVCIYAHFRNIALDESFLKEHIGRCKTLADISTDPFVKKRLLALQRNMKANSKVRRCR